MEADYLSVGEVSRRSGVPISTLHFYERKGMILSRTKRCEPPRLQARNLAAGDRY